MNIAEAKKQITHLFRQYNGRVGGSINSMTRGRIYELYCLSKVVEELHRRNYKIHLVGSTVDFKASPGNIDRSRSYFIIHGSRGGFELHVDIEVTTLGSSLSRGENSDRSAYHEIDIVVVDKDSNGRPSHKQLALGVECKAHAIFRKSTLKEILGLRRELSLLTRNLQPSKLAVANGRTSPLVRADPTSEYWLAHIDPASKKYRLSPSVFDIAFHHWCP